MAFECHKDSNDLKTRSWTNGLLHFLVTSIPDPSFTTGNSGI
jgi:hypothetical protein